MSYKNSIVKKPWGYEYLVYENELVALWFLHIAKGQKTSMHCHPSKTTGLMVINGDAEVSFLSNKSLLTSAEKLMIRKGLFHSTRALGNSLSLFEIETPVDKHDLVRLEDKYGRTGQPYEDSTSELPKLEDCVWIEDPQPNEKKDYTFDKQIVSVRSVTTAYDLLSFLESHFGSIMFLKGGLHTEYGVNVASPGDIVSREVLLRLLQVFPQVHESTVILAHEGTEK